MFCPFVLLCKTRIWLIIPSKNPWESWDRRSSRTLHLSWRLPPLPPTSMTHGLDDWMVGWLCIAMSCTSISFLRIFSVVFGYSTIFYGTPLIYTICIDLCDFLLIFMIFMDLYSFPLIWIGLHRFTGISWVLHGCSEVRGPGERSSSFMHPVKEA